MGGDGGEETPRFRGQINAALGLPWIRYAACMRLAGPKRRKNRPTRRRKITPLSIDPLFASWFRSGCLCCVQRCKSEPVKDPKPKNNHHFTSSGQKRTQIKDRKRAKIKKKYGLCLVPSVGLYL
jgi:hypothetical protein